MNTEELKILRIKVAELRGWTNIHEHEGKLYGTVPDAWELDSQGALENYYEVPNYPFDLNACAEFEKGLTTKQRHDYVRYLTSIMDGWAMMPDFTTTFATAEQRCRAFVALHEEK